MKRVNWKWLSLTMLVSPLLFVVISWCINDRLQAKPRFTLTFTPEEKVIFTWSEGDYLLFNSRSTINNSEENTHRNVYDIREGKHLVTYPILFEGRPSTIHPFSNEDSKKRERFNIHHLDTESDDEFLLHDNETNRYARFVRFPKGTCAQFLSNKPSSHCVFILDKHEGLVNLMMEVLQGNCPLEFLVNMISVMRLKPSSKYWWEAQFVSVVTLPERRRVANHIVSPFQSYFQHHHGQNHTRAISPSGRWLMLADDSDHASGKNHSEPVWTKLYFYDTLKHYWLPESIHLEMGCKGQAHFLSDDLLEVCDFFATRGSAKRVIVHVPTGKIIFQSSKIDGYLSTCTDTNFMSMYVLQQVQLKDKRTQVKLNSINAQGVMLTLHEKTFDIEMHSCQDCAGPQILCSNFKPVILPDWIEKGFSPGRIRELLEDWYQKESCFLYDFISDRIILHRSSRWNGRTSADGRILVLNQSNSDGNVIKTEVYDLPLPVWSPWWGRGIAIALLAIIFAFLIVRPRPKGQSMTA